MTATDYFVWISMFTMGDISSQAAVICGKSIKRDGARDFVPTNELERLVLAIERELKLGKKTEKAKTPGKK